jgi:hypothetical protein
MKRLSFLLTFALGIVLSGCGNSEPSPLSTFYAAALVFVSTALPNGAVNSNYSSTLLASGGTKPYGWSVTTGALPTGLALNAATGQIFGIPTASGTSTFTVKVTDNGTPVQTESAQFSTLVNPTLSATTASLAGGTVGISYSQQLLSNGGTPPVTWSVISGALPAGLSMASSTGTISGSPTTVGTANFTVQAVDSSSPMQLATEALRIDITPAPLTITTTSLSGGIVGAAYNTRLESNGGTQPVIWTVTVGALPGGLLLDAATGAITGSPATVSSTSFTVKATDSASSTPQTATKALSLVVRAPSQLIADGDSITFGAVPLPYTSTLPVEGGWNIKNVGDSGRNLSTMLMDAPTRVDPLFVPGNINVVNIWGGTNDLSNHPNGTPSATFASLKSYCLGRRAAGFKVIIVPMISRTGIQVSTGLTIDQLKDSYNALITANWATFADAMVTLPSILTADGAYANTKYFMVDGVHPTQATETFIIAPTIAAVVNGVRRSVGASPYYMEESVDALLGATIPTTWTMTNGTFSPDPTNGVFESVGSAANNRAMMFFNSFTWPADHYSQVTLRTVTTGPIAGAAVRITSTNGVLTCYFLAHNATQVVLAKLLVDTETILGTPFAHAPQAGDVLRLEAQGSTLTGYLNGTAIITATDSAIATGDAGLYEANGTSGPPSMSAWSGGLVGNTLP